MPSKVITSHLLEDVTDPFVVVRLLPRVAKAGGNSEVGTGAKQKLLLSIWLVFCPKWWGSATLRSQ